MNSSKRHKRGRGPAAKDPNWLGADRERSIAHLHRRMEQTEDGVKKMLLARECRKVRHGARSFAELERFSFRVGLSELRIPAIGVH